MTDIEYTQHLKVEVQTDTPGLQNLIKNPNGEKGGWGWETPVANTSLNGAVDGNGDSYLAMQTTPSQSTYFWTEMLPVSAGRYVVARFNLLAITAGHNVKVKFGFYNSSKVLLAYSTLSAGMSAVQTHFVSAVQAPANTAYVRLIFDLYNGVSNAAAGAYVHFRNAMVASSATSTGFGSIKANRVTNPTGLSGNTTGWSGYASGGVPVTLGTASIGGRSAFLVQDFYGDPSGAYWQGMRMTIPVTAGNYYWFGADFYATNGAMRGVLAYQWVMSDGTVSPPSGMYVTGINDAPLAASTWTRKGRSVSAPSGAVSILLTPFLAKETPWGAYETHYIDRVALIDGYYGNEPGYWDGNTTDTATINYAWSGATYNSISTATVASSGFDYNEPVAWREITGSVNECKVEREAMNLGTMEATLLDESIDPSTSSVLRVGREMRVRALDGDTWTNLFTGKISNARVDYDKDKRPQAVASGTIHITAVDAMGDLANQSESRMVATVAELPYILEGKGVPWNCDGITSHIPSATVQAYSDNASVADQIVITRDTVRGGAWVDRDGILQVRSAASFLGRDSDWYLSDGAPLVGFTNPIPNPGFESAGIGPWEGYDTTTPTIVNSTEQAHSGTRSLKVTSIGSSSGIDIDNEHALFPITEGYTYRFSVWVRSTAASRPFDFSVGFYSSEGYLDGFLWSPPTVSATVSNTGWTEMFIEAYAPVGAVSAYFNVWAIGPAAGESAYFDDFSITPITIDGSYSVIDAEYNTDDIINQLFVKHVTGVGTDTVETTYGPYESTTSLTTYGPRQAEVTVVGSIVPATYASSYLSSNAFPTVKANSLTIPVNDTDDLPLAVGLDLCDVVFVTFADKVADAFRVSKIIHHITHDGWLIDVEFEDNFGNPAPQYTPPAVGNADLQADTGWLNVTFAGTWVNFDARTVQYRRKDGVVYLKGIAKNGTAGTLMFTLPAGFRPTNRGVNEYHLPVVAGDAFGYVTVGSGGEITHRGGSTTWVDLGSISFIAEQ